MNFDDELLQDAQEDARAIAYIKAHLPQELQEAFTEEQLYYFLDVIVDYFTESDILESEPDADGYIEVDQEAVANYLAKQAKKEGIGIFKPEDLLFVVQAQMDFEEEQAE